ncbi:hypothetical protein PR048_025651 [Dryococelus australis]|uniref:Uncharacterized protein n=1 Tax=Dryococelus australis TaxID=614101 RepID=A0ABQ9GJ56_9NEOP|nr:hypothetical protein PR048_025651 [Dryococelus australis]
MGVNPVKLGGGTQEIPEKNPPTSGVVRHDSHMRESGSDPVGDRTQFVLVGGEQANLLAAAAAPSRPEFLDTTPLLLRGRRCTVVDNDAVRLQAARDIAGMFGFRRNPSTNDSLQVGNHGSPPPPPTNLTEDVSWRNLIATRADTGCKRADAFFLCLFSICGRRSAASLRDARAVANNYAPGLQTSPRPQNRQNSWVIPGGLHDSDEGIARGLPACHSKAPATMDGDLVPGNCALGEKKVLFCLDFSRQEDD